ncbi:MAG: acyltransferase family protein [Limisphaerales bacterium]
MLEPVPAISEKGQPIAPFDARAKALRGSEALDQWRGLALILVLISHGFFHTGRVNGAGRVGVNLFFFISGILVFRSLTKEKEEGWDKTRSFWWRRLRRLYPALIAYVVTMLVAALFLQRLPNQPPPRDWASYARSAPFALAYVINYAASAPMALGHLWSLSCEMQFYLLGPLIFLCGGRTMQQRLAVFGTLTAGLAGLGLIYPLKSAHYEVAKYHFEIAVWPMMVGFFCEYARNWFLKLPLALVKVIFALGIFSLAAALSLMFLGMEMKKMVIGVGGFLLLPCLLGYLFGLPMPGKAGCFLRWIGERTYSIYLWQQPFTLCNFLPTLLHPAGAALAIPVGAVWFRWFEKPFLSANRSHRISGAGAARR